jgi:hypothetical protein
MNILEALGDHKLLGSSIRDAESWKPWKGLLAAAFGLPLSSDELALYRRCTGRHVPPGEPASYLWLVIGRRGGKSFAMALIAVFLAAFRDWRPKLSPPCDRSNWAGILRRRGQLCAAHIPEFQAHFTRARHARVKCKLMLFEFLHSYRLGVSGMEALLVFRGVYT